MCALVRQLVTPGNLCQSLSLCLQPRLMHSTTSDRPLTSKDNEGNEEESQGKVVARPRLLVHTHSRDGCVHGVHPQLSGADLPQSKGGQQDAVIVGSRLCPPAGTSSINSSRSI